MRWYRPKEIAAKLGVSVGVISKAAHCLSIIPRYRSGEYPSDRISEFNSGQKARIINYIATHRKKANCESI